MIATNKKIFKKMNYYPTIIYPATIPTMSFYIFQRIVDEMIPPFIQSFCQNMVTSIYSKAISDVRKEKYKMNKIYRERKQNDRKYFSLFLLKRQLNVTALWTQWLFCLCYKEAISSCDVSEEKMLVIHSIWFPGGSSK